MPGGIRRWIVATGLAFALTGSAFAQAVRQESLPAASAVLTETFTALTSVRELSDGRVLLTDPREARLVVADFRTQQVRQIGRTGQGPGEYAWALPVAPLRADSSIMIDGLRRRWLLLDGDSIVHTITVADPAVAFVQVVYGVDVLGNILTSRSPPLDRSGNTIRATDSTYMVLVARTTGRIDTIGRLRPSPPASADAPPPRLRVYEQAVLAPDGWGAVARLDPYRVDWRTPDGRWIRGAPLPVPTERLDAAERAALQESLRAGQRPGSIRWPDFLPPFTAGWSPIPTMDGRVLVRRTQSVRNPGVRYDVINRRGELEKQLLLLANERILGFSASSVYVVVRDQDDLETIRRHVWR